MDLIDEGYHFDRWRNPVGDIGMPDRDKQVSEPGL
jgi:hypothetical protein